MTESDIQYLKENIDKLVEIRTIDDECLIAKVLVVTHNNEYDEHDLLYEVISSNQIDSYTHLDSTGGYVLDFERIASVGPAPQSETLISGNHP
jgi:hypothetical protein